MGHGDFSNITKFLTKMSKNNFRSTLEKYGQEGVEALKSSTPSLTGETANSWTYEISDGGESIELAWLNHKVTVNGVPIVVLLRWGHGTGTGGYVKGREFITPAIEPIFNRFLNDMWEEVIRS